MSAPIADRLGEVQLALRDARLEGWLLTDHRATNPIALRALGLRVVQPMRRVFYWLPADGMPVMVAHAIEAETLPELPGELRRYVGWTELRRALERTLPSRGQVAMEHQPMGGVPDLSRVDAGTLQLVESYGPRVVPSIDLVNALLGAMSADERARQERTYAALREVREAACAWLADERSPTERGLRALVEEEMASAKLLSDRPALIATGPRTRHRSPRHSGDEDRAIEPRDLVIIELYATDAPLGPYAHLALTGVLREASPDATRAFSLARRARDAALELLAERFATGARVLGYEVDRAARAALDRPDEGGLVAHRPWAHRSGHHLGWCSLSAEACTFDDLEVHDTREALVGLAWSLHPGVYEDELGLRAHAAVRRGESSLELLEPGQDALRVIGG